MTPLYAEAQDRMAPGRITETGFLGNDKRTLLEIIEADEQKISALKLDWNDISDKLNYMLQEGIKGLGQYRTVDGRWLVRVDDTRGKLPSPFKDGLFFKRAVHVKNIRSGKSLIFSDLSLHLLQEHHFLQGKGSPFRLEPEQIKSVLEL